MRREVVKNNNESGRLVGEANEGGWDQAAGLDNDGIFFYASVRSSLITVLRIQNYFLSDPSPTYHLIAAPDPG